MQFYLSIWQFDSPNTHTYMFLPKRLYIYFLSFLFLISMKKKKMVKSSVTKACISWKRKPHLNLQKFPGSSENNETNTECINIQS